MSRPRSVVRVLLVLFLIPYLPATSSAATYLGSFKGHDYYATSPSLTLSAARAEAAALAVTLGRRVYLAAVATTEEREFLACLATQEYWIGLERLPGLPLDAYRWAWDSGEPYVYNPDLWCAGEPNNYFGQGENAVVFPWGFYCFNDLPGTEIRPPGGLMEVEPNE